MLDYMYRICLVMQPGGCEICRQEADSCLHVLEGPSLRLCRKYNSSVEPIAFDCGVNCMQGRCLPGSHVESEFKGLIQGYNV